MLVEVEDLRVTLRKSKINILDGVSFHINERETLGVVGPATQPAFLYNKLVSDTKK